MKSIDEQTEFILLDDLRIDVIRNPRRKRLSLEVASKGIVARAPELSLIHI